MIRFCADIVQPRITGRPEAFSVQLQNLKAETTGAGGRAIYKVVNLSIDWIDFFPIFSCKCLKFWVPITNTVFPVCSWRFWPRVSLSVTLWLLNRLWQVISFLQLITCSSLCLFSSASRWWSGNYFSMWNRSRGRAPDHFQTRKSVRGR